MRAWIADPPSPDARGFLVVRAGTRALHVLPPRDGRFRVDDGEMLDAEALMARAERLVAEAGGEVRLEVER